MHKQTKLTNFSIRYAKESLLEAYTYSKVIEDMILSLDYCPYDEDYMHIYWKDSVSDFIYNRYVKLENL